MDLCKKNAVMGVRIGGLESSTYFSGIAGSFIRDTIYCWALWEKGVALGLLWSLLSL